MCQFVEIFNQIETNGAVSNFEMKILCNSVLHNFFIRRLILRHLTLFDWKFLQIGTLRAKDLGKNLSKLQSGRLNPVPLTLLVIRVVLLLWSYGVSNPLIPQLYIIKARL